MSDKKHVMVDLETMGTRPGSPILSIGACRFSMEAADDAAGETVEFFYQPVTLESCLELGMRPSASTVIWWCNQTEDAREVLTDAAAVSLPIALDSFTDWLMSRPDEIWGNSARFDLGLLESAYAICGKVVPWEFWNERCYRTIKNIPGAKAVPFHNTGTAHNALDDAIAQAEHLRRIYAALSL